MEEVELPKDGNEPEKIIVRIDLDNKRICTKPLILGEYLNNVRDKIKSKVKEKFSFLDKNGKIVKKENEAFFRLSNIIYDNNIIKLKCESLSEIKILVNNIQELTIRASKDEKLANIRKLLASKCYQNFIFLDEDGNDIDKEDENDYKISDIINNDEIKISSDTFRDAPPALGNDNYDDKKSKNETPFAEKPTNNKISLLKFNETWTKTINNLITFHHIGNEIRPVVKQNIENKNLKKKKEFDFTKFENYKKLNGITYYKYSKLKSQKPIDSVYLNYYDKYNMEFDEDIAYVLLFCGKTGDGKTTAINSFFNIIKGVKKEDKYRFILIEEPPKKISESQTEGVHLYFVRDNEDLPIVIIDSAGYGDTKGKEYDEKLNEAFSYIFSNLITHINSINFVVKSNDTKIGYEAKYIFNCITSLFAGDMTENFIVLSTHAEIYTIREGPKFIRSLKEADKDINFLKLNTRNDKWWYAVDSRSIMDNRDDQITEFSFNNFKDFYEKVKSLSKKSIQKSSELLSKRLELKSRVNKLIFQFSELFNKKDVLQQKIDIIQSIENERNKLSQDPTIEEINNIKSHINNLNTKILVKEIVLRISNNDCNVCCKICKRNCHSPCDCFLRSLSRCHIFPVFSNGCEICGCNKRSHSQDRNYYIEVFREEECPQIEEQIRILSDFLERFKEMEREKNAEKLAQTQMNLDAFKNDKREIEEEISRINKDIQYNVITLKILSERINEIAMNNNSYQTEEEYLSDLIAKLREKQNFDENKIKTLKKMESNIKIILEIIRQNKDSLYNLEETNFNLKIREIIEINDK